MVVLNYLAFGTNFLGFIEYINNLFINYLFIYLLIYLFIIIIVFIYFIYIYLFI